jgi:hypothetical protein
MKGRIIRNGLLTLVLTMSAVVLPGQKAVADNCAYVSEQWALCVSAGGGQWCDEYYWSVVVPACT